MKLLNCCLIIWMATLTGCLLCLWWKRDDFTALLLASLGLLLTLDRIRGLGKRCGWHE